MLLAGAVLAGPASAETIAAYTQDWQRFDGFVRYYQKAESGAVLVEANLPGRDFLYGIAVSRGAGSHERAFERGRIEELRLCRFERVGARLLLVQRTTRFRDGRSTEPRPALEESFASSVLASLPIVAEEQGRVLVDAAPFLLGSQHAEPLVGSAWAQDPDRSLVLPDRSGAFPRNTDFETLMTFTANEPRDPVATLLPDRRTLTITIRHTFVALPEDGFEARFADPRIGFFGPSYRDVGAAFDEPADRRLAARWRLLRRNPGSATSEAENPIVLYLDPAIPARYRDAVRGGVLWWNHAFEAVGFRDALVLRDMPAGASFADVRYPGLQWTHADEPARSQGSIRFDPRTGEILHAVVSLDSAHTRASDTGAGRPDFLGAECGLALDPRLGPALHERLLLGELAYIAAHEVGHVLGLAHNMAASTYAGSVMDYLPAALRVEAGRVVGERTYPTEVGPYDEMAIRWAYSPGLTAADREAIVREGLARGLVYPQQEDARWARWDLGADPVRWLEERLTLRDALLGRLASEGVRDGEPMQELYRRFESVYDMHLAAVAAAARLVGGVSIVQSVKGDAQQPYRPMPPEEQRRALQAVLQTLRPERLAVPEDLEPLLLPGATTPGEAAYPSEAGMAFSPGGRARSLAKSILDALLVDEGRLARLTAGRSRDSLTIDEVLTAVTSEAWRRRPGADPGRSELERVVQGCLIDTMLELAGTAGRPEVRAAVLDHLVRLRARLSTATASNPGSRAHVRLLRRRIDAFLALPGTASGE